MSSLSNISMPTMEIQTKEMQPVKSSRTYNRMAQPCCVLPIQQHVAILGWRDQDPTIDRAIDGLKPAPPKPANKPVTGISATFTPRPANVADNPSTSASNPHGRPLQGTCQKPILKSSTPNHIPGLYVDRDWTWSSPVYRDLL